MLAAAAGMGGVRVSGRAGTPRFVAEGCEEAPVPRGGTAWGCQPSQAQEDEAAWVLAQYLSTEPASQHVGGEAAPAYTECACMNSSPHVLDPMHGASGAATLRCRLSARAAAMVVGPLQPIAEGRESIAAFHPSWHLRASGRPEPGELAEEADNSQNDDGSTGSMLEQFWRPAGITQSSSGALRQPSIAAQAGCSNFSSHVVNMKQGPPPSAQQPKRYPIDDAVLSSEESEDGAGYSDYESEPEEDPRGRSQTWQQGVQPGFQKGPALIGRV